MQQLFYNIEFLKLKPSIDESTSNISAIVFPRSAKLFLVPRLTASTLLPYINRGTFSLVDLYLYEKDRIHDQP